MDPWIVSAIVVFVYMNFGFVLSLILKRNDLADMMWGPGFLVAALSFWPEPTPRVLLTLTAVGVWALRLSGYIIARNSGQSEDWRYRQWRDSWGKHFILRSYFQVWILQGALLYAIAYPLLVEMRGANFAPDFVFLWGLIFWGSGLLFETIGDEQLRLFKKDPANKGKVMQSGLWRYTRHPNYFGEALMWWGFALGATSLPGGLYAPLSAVLMTFMLLRVSGVTMTEKRMETRPEFAAYKKRTSAFVPWWPKAE